MTYEVLARKWRPAGFAEMAGQDHVLKALVNALDAGRLHHAYLFTGTRGVGKTTVARIFARCLNCEQGVCADPCGACASCREIVEGRFVDLIEVDAASRTRVEDTRELLDNVQYAPTRGRYKVYLIDEVHMLSAHSFNALLKTLEEPPPHVKFLLATTDPRKLPVTVLSRCLQFHMKNLTPETIAEHLGRVLEAEGVAYEGPALVSLARAADGSMRDALSLADQAIAFCEGRLEAEPVAQLLGTVDRSALERILGALAAGDGATLLACVDTLAEHAADFSTVLADLLSALHAIAVAQAVPDAVHDRRDRHAELVAGMAERVTPEDVQLYYQIGVMGQRDLPWAPDPRAGFEMTLLRMLAFRPEDGSRRAGSGAAQGADAPPAAEADATGAVEQARSGPEAGAPGAPPEAARARGAGGAEDWHALLPRLGLEGLTRALAEHCMLLEVEGDHWRLALDPEGEALLSDVHVHRMEAALAAVVGGAPRLRVEVARTGGETPYRRRVREADERQRRAVAAIERDETVRMFQERFNASLQPDSIRPLQ